MEGFSMRSLLMAITAAAALAVSTPSQATTVVDFSFTNCDDCGNTNGTVTGQIDFSSASGTQSAIAVYITSAPFGGLSPSLNILTETPYSSENSFMLSGGNVTSAGFQWDWGNFPVWGLLLQTGGNENVYDYNTACGCAYQDVEAFTVTFTPVAATPLPSTWSMLLGGLLALGFIAYRQKKRDVALAAA
jgi:hypothetical protein